MEVHFNAHSAIANILSVSDVANLPNAKLTMDTSEDRAIILHFNGRKIRFKECVDGLYYWDTTTNNTPKPKQSVTNYSLLNTVDSNKCLFTKQEVEGAEAARSLQGQLSWPSETEFMKIVSNNHIINSRVTPDDIKKASNTYKSGVPSFIHKSTFHSA